MAQMKLIKKVSSEKTGMKKAGEVIAGFFVFHCYAVK
jgi:hypothetical protein